MNSKSFNLSYLAENWPSPLVARDQSQLDKFSGGLLNARTLANADSLGIGPKGRVKFGRKVAYTKEALIAYMQEKMDVA